MNLKEFFSKQNTTVKVLMLVMLLWLVWLLGSLLVGQVRDLFVQTEDVRFVTMERVENGYGMLSPTEHIISATVDGTVEELIAEGERVRKGNAVFRIGETYHYTNYAGRVSYVLDGLENMTDIASVAALDWKAFYNAQQKKSKKSDSAVAGESYAKVQETLGNMVLYLQMPNMGQVAMLEVGQTITIQLTDVGTQVSGKVIERLDTEDGNRCIKLEISLANEQMLQQRLYQVAFPYDSERVIPISEQALVRKNGVDGVYCLHKGFVFWQEVVVSDRWSDQGILVVEEGLTTGDVVVTTPRLVREGENIKF